METGNKVFWFVTLALLAASAWFGTKAEGQRRLVQRGEANLELREGAEVGLAQVIDGDTLLVTTPAGRRASVRLVGIKAFDAGVDKAMDSVAIDAQARERIVHWFEGNLARVHLNTPPKDSHGRFLVHLTMGEEDIARVLLREGLVLVYPVYPFEQFERYWADQEVAQARREGLWAVEALAQRAERLLTRWQEQAR